MESDLKNWLSRAINSKLIAVFALIYMYDGLKDYKNPQELSLELSKSDGGRLACGEDGRSIDWIEGELKEADLGELASQYVEDVSDFPEWKEVVGKIIVDAKLIYSSIENCLIGFSLSFEGGLNVSIVNLGDEIFVYRSIPEIVSMEQGITFISLA